MPLFSYKQEIFRKLIHLSSVVYPLIYVFIDQVYMIGFLLWCLFVVTVFDLLRIYSKYGKFLSFLNVVLRDDEVVKKKFSGAFFFILAFLLVTIFFPKEIAIISMLILVVCDTCAALVGIKLGRIKFLNKSLEGFVAFLLSGLLVIYLYQFIYPDFVNLEYKNMMYALFCAGIAEFIAKVVKIDDNLLITIVFATVLNIL